MKQLVDEEQLKRPRVESRGQGYEVSFDLDSGLRDVNVEDVADGRLTTFRGQVKRFRTHRTLIQNMKKMGIGRWRCRLDPEDA
ncbi:MAG: hypothetical protein ABJ308_18295 [Halieaceae bacterium]